jgi:methyl-accepting chemotaxis protein
MDSISVKAGGISRAVEEQKTTVSEVAKASEDLSAITQGVLARVNSLMDSFGELQKQILLLKSIADEHREK